ncbi:hypothetical protein QJS66_09920 [Kocuria rhizophila]|nr:hypothetical protein QJS66_09920 [Kocuria rhizophila]
MTLENRASSPARSMPGPSRWRSWSPPAPDTVFDSGAAPRAAGEGPQGHPGPRAEETSNLTWNRVHTAEGCPRDGRRRSPGTEPGGVPGRDHQRAGRPSCW